LIALGGIQFESEPYVARRKLICRPLYVGNDLPPPHKKVKLYNYLNCYLCTGRVHSDERITGNPRNYLGQGLRAWSRLVTRTTRLVVLVLLVAPWIGTDCQPPPNEPVLTACATNGVACIYDGVARQPASLVYFRPTSRWPRTNLTWQLVQPSEKLGLQSQLDTIERAFFAWAEVSTLTFQCVDAEADIVISFMSGDLGDGSRFDGRPDEGYNEMARAFFPGATRSGLIQLDADEAWSLGPLPDRPHLFTIVLHEIGHALGLEHSEAVYDAQGQSVVMAPEYTGPVSGLTQDDIDAIQRLYGSADVTVAPVPVPVPGEFAVAPPDLTLQGDTDSDGDGIPDTIETFALGTDPFSDDSNGDGVKDYTAVFISGTRASPGCPLARAQTDRSAIEGGKSAKLNGRFSSDPDGLPLNYSWQQIGGPDVAIYAANTATPSFVTPRSPSDVTVTFELTVDNGICSSTDTVSILIWGEAAPALDPVADAGPDQTVDPGLQIILDGSRSVDPNYLELSFSWSQTAGPSLILSDSTAQKPTFQAPQVGTLTNLTFQLSVSNGTAIDTDTVNITVRARAADTDGDGLSDEDEIYFYGTDPHNADTDGDGIHDGQDNAPTNARFS